MFARSNKILNRQWMPKYHLHQLYRQGILSN
jgi:hypothetical protein